MCVYVVCADVHTHIYIQFHFFSKGLLSANHVPGTVPGAGDPQAHAVGPDLSSRTPVQCTVGSRNKINNYALLNRQKGRSFTRGENNVNLTS